MRKIRGAAPARDEQRLDEFQRDADACEMFVGVRAVRALWIDDRDGGGKRRARFVVIGDDQINAELARANGRIRRANAAIDRDDQPRAGGVQPLDRCRLQAVSVTVTMGDEVMNIAADQLDRALENDG